MKKIVFGVLCALTFIFAGVANAYVSVKGYYRKDGTYVAPHVRSNPNGLKSDNYGYKGGNAYNPSYYTSSSSYWKTPTTVTDPSYYAGKNYYETNTTPSTVSTYTAVNPPKTEAKIERELKSEKAKLDAGSKSSKKSTPSYFDAEIRKIANSKSMDRWGELIVDKYITGIYSWDEAIDLYAFIASYHN